MEDFWRIVQSMRQAADAAGVKLVTGDTKVVDRGKADKIFINTSGLGVIPEGVDIHPRRAQAGDKILVSGPIAMHGIAIMSVREGLEFETEIASDSAALNGLVEKILRHEQRHPRFARSDTRRRHECAHRNRADRSSGHAAGGSAYSNQRRSQRGVRNSRPRSALRRERRQIHCARRRAADADRVLAAMKSHPLGREAAIIGEVTQENTGFVLMKTRVGGTRVVDMLSGEQLPRIC